MVIILYWNQLSLTLSNRNFPPKYKPILDFWMIECNYKVRKENLNGGVINQTYLYMNQKQLLYTEHGEGDKVNNN